MTERTPTPSAKEAARDPEVREAKGAAHEAIGKLLGDDQAVRDGRSEQREAGADSALDTDIDAAGEDAPRATTSKTEQE